jgi:riboflavin synthase
VVMGNKGVGEDVNVEIDMVGKYVEKSVRAYFEETGSGGPAVLERMVERVVGEKMAARNR